MKFLIKPFVFYLFLIGISLGLILSKAFPAMCEYYSSLYHIDVQTFATGLGSKLGYWGIILAIFSRNFILVSILLIGPHIIASTCARNNQDPKKLLILFTICSMITYGFFPYGMFIGNLLLKFKPEVLLKWLLYFIPHGPLENFIILSAGSTGMFIIDRINKGEAIREILNFKKIEKKLILAVISLAIVSLIETFVSPLLL